MFNGKGYYLKRHFDRYQELIIPKLSGYFDILRANTLLYEMLLAAPHGSAQFYTLNEGHVAVVEEWEENEKQLYKDTICEIQESMYGKFESLCVSQHKEIDIEHQNLLLAKLVLKSA